MNKPSFLIGTLLGWITAWLLDFLVRSPRREDEYDELHGALRNAVSDAASLRAQLAAANAAVEALKTQVASTSAVQAGATGGEERVGAGEPEAAAALSFAAEQVAGAAAAQAPQGLLVADDLTLLEGIGPKIALLLTQNGIHSFAQLAGSDVAALRAILEAAGPRFRLADPDTWPEQARLARDGDWEGLKALRSSLRAGR